MAVSFIGEGNWNTQKKPTDLSKVTDKLSHNVSNIPCLDRVRTHTVSGDRH